MTRRDAEPFDEPTPRHPRHHEPLTNTVDDEAAYHASEARGARDEYLADVRDELRQDRSGL